MATTASEVVVEPVRRELSRTRIDVAADVAGEEVVEEGGDEVRAGQAGRSGAAYPWASSSTRQRQVEMARMPA